MFCVIILRLLRAFDRASVRRCKGKASGRRYQGGRRSQAGPEDSLIMGPLVRQWKYDFLFVHLTETGDVGRCLRAAMNFRCCFLNILSVFLLALRPIPCVIGLTSSDLRVLFKGDEITI